ncbi:hypothetical protein BH23ACT7_BH23ACT7_01130 [soil metagenome]|nr:hypothetical protein [Euzebyaceae bacterium]
MSTESPLERILRLRADDDPREPQTVHEWLRRNGGTSPEGRWTLATFAARTAAGEDFFFGLREFLDGFYGLFTNDHREALVRDRPDDLDDPRLDAFLGALAEHFAAVHGFDRPAWATERHRFLDRYWFAAEEPGFRAMAVVESPAAFRRRGIMITDGLLFRL